MDQSELYHALRVVQRDAAKRVVEEAGLIGGKPLNGWSQEKHDQYHQVRLSEARETLHYCFVRQMQIDPD